jgi:tRNA(Ile)-lysidine synthase
MVAAGDTVLVSVSGGPDSICLLHALVRLRRLLRIRLAVFHYDHRLRADSSGDADYVQRTAGRLGLPFHLVEAASSPPRGASVEAWAHDVRSKARLVVAHELGADRIATAHTLDDQAETVLMRALTGAGTPGLAGIRPVAGPLIRPLLDVTREEVEAFDAALHLRPRRDPTNLDPRFLRNAIRLRGLPALERAVGRSVREPLARSGELAREDDDELARLATAAWPSAFEPLPDGGRISTAALRPLPDPVANRVIVRAIDRAGGAARRADVLAVADLARGRPGREVDLIGGLKARRERGYVRFVRASPGDPASDQTDGTEGGA